jgi:cytochrome c peroxidase
MARTIVTRAKRVFAAIGILALVVTSDANAQRRVTANTNHLGTQILELMAGANGDSSVQFIEMTHGGCGATQNLWGPGESSPASRAMLVFYDGAGNETYRYKFTAHAPCSEHILIGTQGFIDMTGAAVDFLILPVMSPGSGKVCFKGNTAEAGFFAFQRNECVSYGSFTGDTEVNVVEGDLATPSFGPPAAALPITNTVSLERISLTESNASFALTTSPSPTNSNDDTFSFPSATLAEQGETIFKQETFGGNGRTCASCHVPEISFGLNPSNIQSRFAGVSSTFDPLFIGETTFNLNTLVITNPTSTGIRGVRDMRGVITGSAGGTAKILTKLNAEGSSEIRYLVYGGLNPTLAGTVSDTNGNTATVVSITAGTLACSAGGSPTATCVNQLEHPGKMRTSVDSTNFPNGRGLILENIDGFTVPHSSNHVFRKSPVVENAKFSGPFGLSGEFLDLIEFSEGAVKQHFTRTIDRVPGVDFRPPTIEELQALDAFQQSLSFPADEDFDLDKFATTAAQKRGRTVFFGETAKCSKCHSGAVLANVDGSIPGRSDNARFNTGVVNLPINTAQDLLPAEAFGNREFSTPALFNVKNHAPFFHDASAATLHQAVEFYTSASFQASPAVAEVGTITMTAPEIDDIVSFLEGLTPRDFSLTGGPLSFGTRNTGDGPTATQQITVTNTSGGTITFESPFVRITGPNAGDFVLAGTTLGSTLASGATATVDVAFDPATGGAKEAVLEVLGDTPSGVDLSGMAVQPPPNITGVSPTSGPTTGGHVTTLTGTDLAGATVTIGGNNATISSNTAATIVFTTPAHAAGAVNITVTTGGGSDTVTNAYTYIVPAINVTPTSGLVTTEAGGTATFSLVLTTKPLAGVTVPITSTDTGEGSVSPANVVFTTANWNVPKVVTVTGVNDQIVDGNIGYTINTGFAVSTDAAYSGKNPANVSATNNDNDTIGVTVTPTTGLTTTQLGGTATFTMRLTAQPFSNVTIGLTSSDTTEGTVSPSSVVFTSANWNTPQTVTVTGVNDSRFDAPMAYSIVTAAAVSSDVAFNGFNAADVAVTNQTVVTASAVIALRNSVNAKRATAGLGAFAFTDPSLTGVPVRVVHITQLRTAVDQARAVLGQSTGGFTDPVLTSGSPVRAVHFQQIKDRL